MVLVKVPVIEGEEVLQYIVSRDIILNNSGENVKNIKTEVTKLKAEIHNDMVLIRGKLKCKIMYAAGGEAVCFQAKDIYFDRLASLPGCTEDMGVDLESEIMQVDFHTGRDSNRLHIKIYLRCFLRIHRWQKKRVAVGEGPLVEVKKIIAEKSGRKLLREHARTADNVREIIDFGVEPGKVEFRTKPGKICFSGFLTRKLDYLDNNQIEHRQSEDFPFKFKFGLPEVAPPVEADYRLDIKEIKYNFFPRDTMLIQKFLLEFSVDVWKRTRMRLKTGNDVTVMLPEIVEGVKHEKVQFCIENTEAESGYQPVR